MLKSDCQNRPSRACWSHNAPSATASPRLTIVAKRSACCFMVFSWISFVRFDPLPDWMRWRILDFLGPVWFCADEWSTIHPAFPFDPRPEIVP
jgi:hypothetical protein